MSSTLRDLLLPELESEFAKTRKVLLALPDLRNDFKPHEKSFTLARLAGHTAELPHFITTILTSPDLDFSADPSGRGPYHMETAQQALAEFNELADKTVTAMKETSYETFHQHWRLSWKSHEIYSGSRYGAYRELGVNHLVHHRAQLGVYLRMLDGKVPATFGPSADEPG